MFDKFFTKKYLSSWKKNRDYVIPEGMNEAFKGRESLYVKRAFRPHDIYVDIYWYIMQPGSSSKLDFLYRRCAWDLVRQNVEEVENTELAQAVLECEL